MSKIYAPSFIISAWAGSERGKHDYRPWRLSCGRPPWRPPVHPGVRPGVLPDVHPEIPDDLERISCRKGLSAAQINIIGLLLAIGPTVTPYKQISAELERVYSMKRTPGAVRRSIERLANRGCLRRKQAKVGTSQGVIITLIPDMLCPCIRASGQCPCTPSTLTSRADALLLLREAIAAGAKVVDIGLWQVNLWWCGRFGINPEDLLEPAYNESWGRWILADEISRHGLTWKAVGKYHSPDDETGRAYAWRIFQAADMKKIKIWLGGKQ